MRGRVFSYTVALQGTGREGAVMAAIAAGAATADYDRLRAAYAYASAGGAVFFVHTLRDAVEGWDAARKSWLISLDWGHTEPEALEYLASLPLSEVRVPNAAQVIASGLTPRTCFHPKTLLLDQRARPNSPPATLAIGSANLTVSGLRVADEHVSVATWTAGRLTAAGQAELFAMRSEAAHLDATWRRASRLTTRLVSEYRTTRNRVRPRRRTTFEGRAEDASTRVRELEDRWHFEYQRVAELLAAQSLWVEIDYVVANRGAGVAGNQIDLAAGTRAFFGLDPSRLPRNTPLGSVRLRYGAHSAIRNLRFGNNQMDKLDLPIPGVDGPRTYEKTVLLFRRNDDGSFDMRLGTPRLLARWKSASDARGTRFRMNSGREWGAF
jgi:hypothetical protein